MRYNKGSEGVPTKYDWRLNERHYGALQGLNKAETAEKHGAEQVHIWRRSFDVAPPDGESLEMTAERTIPYFAEEILPDLVDGKNVRERGAEISFENQPAQWGWMESPLHLLGVLTRLQHIDDRSVGTRSSDPVLLKFLH